jgi:hypothetical protein
VRYDQASAAGSALPPAARWSGIGLGRRLLGGDDGAVQSADQGGSMVAPFSLAAPPLLLRGETTMKERHGLAAPSSDAHPG